MRNKAVGISLLFPPRQYTTPHSFIARVTGDALTFYSYTPCSDPPELPYSARRAIKTLRITITVPKMPGSAWKWVKCGREGVGSGRSSWPSLVSQGSEALYLRPTGASQGPGWVGGRARGVPGTLVGRWVGWVSQKWAWVRSKDIKGCVWHRCDHVQKGDSSLPLWALRRASRGPWGCQWKTY